MTERKLATIRVVQGLKPIKDADRIELALIDGWQVVVKKNEYQVGDLAIYFEIDSWVPHGLASFLTKEGKEKTYNGVPGNRLRTVKLKGEISQGLLLPMGTLAEEYDEGADLTDLLQVQKWEPEIPAQLAGQVKGTFPSFIPKTDQERIQNIRGSLVGTYEVTEKLDGSSMTVFIDEDGEFNVCSRNMNLKRDENNTFWKTAISEDLEAKLRGMGSGVVLQGELIGQGIQGNSYSKIDHHFIVFDIFNYKTQEYSLPLKRRTLCSIYGLKHVPVIIPEYELTTESTKESILKISEDKSNLCFKAEREGLVFKSLTDHQFSFKAISNKWLLAND